MAFSVQDPIENSDHIDARTVETVHVRYSEYSKAQIPLSEHSSCSPFCTQVFIPKYFQRMKLNVCSSKTVCRHIPENK